MLDCVVLVIVHYDGEFDFDFDITRPLYKGGKQKMRSLSTNITYTSLLNVALEISQVGST